MYIAFKKLQLADDASTILDGSEGSLFIQKLFLYYIDSQKLITITCRRWEG